MCYNTGMDIYRIIQIAQENNAIGFKHIGSQLTLWKKDEILNRYCWLHFEYSNGEYKPISVWECTSRIPANLLNLDRLSLFIVPEKG